MDFLDILDIMVTLVTMFFDIKTTRPRSFYMENCETLLLDIPMVIFCDESTYPDIAIRRGNRPTTYIKKPIYEYEFYASLLPIVESNRKIRPSSDPRNTSEYFLLTVFKIYALYIASQQTDATHYMWIDFGLSHVARSMSDGVYSIVRAPRPRIACCYIHYRSKKELYPMRDYVTGRCGIACGVISVEKQYVEKLYLSFISILHEQILDGVGHAEEQIMVYVFDQHPEWFSIYFGDYSSIVTNYHTTVEDVESVKHFFIQNAQQDNQHALAEDAYKSIQ